MNPMDRYILPSKSVYAKKADAQTYQIGMVTLSNSATNRLGVVAGMRAHRRSCQYVLGGNLRHKAGAFC